MPTTPGRSGNATVTSILSFVCAVAAPALWFLLVDFELLRSTALVSWLCIVASVAFGVTALRHGKGWGVRLRVGVSFAVCGMFGLLFLVALTLPPSAQLAALTLAPDFTLPDQNGQLVHLRDPNVKGPTLLVFFRGHW